MNDPRRHHYVPQFYQKGFADTDELLWLYDRQRQRYTKVHPRNICCEKELYTIDPKGRQSRQIESKWLSRIDGDGATAIRQFEHGVQPLDQGWKESFSIFMAQQITRTPVFRDMTAQTFRAMREEYLRIGFTDVERARQFLENYRAQTGDPAEGVTAESMVEAVVGGHRRATVGEGPFLEHMVGQVEFLARWIAAFEWEVVTAPVGNTGFIICDYPFVVVPPREHPEAIGFGFRGTVKYFPLTRGLCLRMGEQDSGFSYRGASKEDVRVINQNVAVNSERFIMGPSREQLEHVIARSLTAATDLAPRTTAEAIHHDRDSALIRVCQQITRSTSGQYAIVPVTMKPVSSELEFGHLLIGDSDSWGIGIGVQFAFHSQACGRCGAGDEIDDHLVADQRLAPPVLADE